MAARVYYRITWFNEIKNRHGISVKPSINDIVLIEEENLKRMDWTIGKIDKLFCSKNGGEET